MSNLMQQNLPFGSVGTRNIIDGRFGTLSSSLFHASMAMKRLADMISEQQDRLEAVTSSIEDGIVLLDETEKPIFHNPLGKALFEGACRCTNGRPCRLHRAIAGVRTTGQEKTSLELVIGTEPFRFTCKRIPDQSGSFKISLVFQRERTGITEPESISDKILDQLNPAPVLPELVAALAHEVNNPLTPIIGLSDEAWQDRRNSFDVPNPMNVIQESGQRISSVLKQLLRFNHVYAYGHTSSIRLDAVVRDSVARYRKETPDTGLQIEYRLDDADSIIRTNAARLQQVLIYLFHYFATTAEDGHTFQIAVTTELNKDLVQIRLSRAQGHLWDDADDRSEPVDGTGDDEFRDIHLILADILGRSISADVTHVIDGGKKVGVLVTLPLR